MTPTAVYVLECEGGAWYVGLSYQPYKRYIRHLEGDGAYFTMHYRPVRIASVRWYASRARAEYMEEVMTSAMREQALKVGGGSRTTVGMSGRAKCRYHYPDWLNELTGRLRQVRVAHLREDTVGVPKKRIAWERKNATYLVKAR